MDKMAPTGEKMKKVTIKESNLREKLADMIRKEVREAMGVMGGDNMNGDDEDFHNQNISAGPTL